MSTANKAQMRILNGDHVLASADIRVSGQEVELSTLAFSESPLTVRVADDWEDASDDCDEDSEDSAEKEAGVQSLAVRGPIADTMDQIFEPIRFETLADLFTAYASDHRRMVDIAGLFDGSNAELVQHFIDGNVYEDRHSISPERLFELGPAVKALDASYWSKALALTDVLESMPQARRDAWHNLIREHEAPSFDQQSVVSTLQDLLVQRHRFFAERVDGIFQSLSHEHVTNRPEGFSKRMIIAYVYGAFGAESSRCGTINDLRCVIARFMGRDEPRTLSTHRIVERARREQCGEWVVIDGGSMRIRIYKKGTAHLEVHPEMAWRLNMVLASLYPNAIPEQHRRRPNTKPPKDFQLFSRPLPFAVLDLLSDMRGPKDGTTFQFDYGAHRSPAYREACDVLGMLGGEQREDVFTFDYDPHAVIREVVASGMIPDQRAHQFYPTPRALAERVVLAANVGASDTVLEPSAGHGALADLLPRDRTTLVEVSHLGCSVLEAKGYEVLRQDFLRWSPGRRFDRIVMNPPFTDGQWKRHLEHAAELLAWGGRLVAVLPSGARSRRDLLPGWTCSWSDPEPFPGTSIEVVVLIVER